MISSAFKGAYQNEVSQQNQGINTITKGVTDTATAVIGALGFAGALGSGTVATASKHALANKVGGVGGNLMLATMQEKQETGTNNKTFTAKEVSDTIATQLGDNPINRSAIKQLGTVFETLQRAKEENIINKKGVIESNLGDIDPNSELGKKILENINSSEKKNDSNLKTAIVYHGSNYDFNKFDPEESKKHRGSVDYMGEGFYFSDNPEVARLYGNKVYKTEIQYSTDYKKAKIEGSEADYKYNKEKGYWVIPYKFADRIKILNKENIE